MPFWASAQVLVDDEDVETHMRFAMTQAAPILELDFQYSGTRSCWEMSLIEK